MAEVKFGTKQLKNPTPLSRSKPIDIFSGIAGVVIGWLGTAPYIPSHVTNVLVSVLGLLISVAQVLKPFWGVPAEEVTEEEKPE